MLDPRLAEYELRHGCRIVGRLSPGPGQDGSVYRTDRLTAAKFFDSRGRFARENEVYLVLRSKGIREIAGHHVPLWKRCDEELLVIEMSIVDRPYLLDFASARGPAEVPDFEPHVLEDYYDGLREKFGDHWEAALHVAAMFKLETGFQLMDLHPGNIAFCDS